MKCTHLQIKYVLVQNFPMKTEMKSNGTHKNTLQHNMQSKTHK